MADFVQKTKDTQVPRVPKSSFQNPVTKNRGARWTITDEFGNVRLDNTDLPGVFTSLTISQEIKIEENEIKGRSGKSKQVIGYDDATVNLELILLSDDESTCYDKLNIIQRVFRNTDSAALPKVFKVINKHINARKIRDVLFRSLTTSEGSGDTLSVSIQLEEYLPIIPVRKEARAATPTGLKSGGASSPEAKYADEMAQIDREHDARAQRLLADNQISNQTKHDALKRNEEMRANARENALARREQAKAEAAKANAAKGSPAKAAASAPPPKR